MDITGILHDFLRRFTLHLPGDVLDVVASPLLVGFDELVEVALVPNGESLLKRRGNKNFIFFFFK